MATVWNTVRIAIRFKTWAASSPWPLLFSLCLVSGTQVSQASEADVSKEYQVKAAFLYSFTKFVEWPPNCFSAKDSPIVIGVFGRNPFGDELEKIVQTRKVNGRGFTVKTISSTADLSGIHLLFVPRGEEGRLVEKATAFVPSPGTLTIGESDQFAAVGGIINFVTDIDKVHFQINREAADRAGVKISAQLMKLAVLNRKKE